MEEYIVSARKYRPMTFDSVVGQSALTTTLKNAVKSGKLAHAYLFCGPRGVGKTTCARIFAKAINCEHPREDGEACNTCESCQAFNEQRSYNIFELDAASNNGVDQIKTLMEQTRIPPQVGKYKVFIIDEVHMLSAAAFNAFLKTLEEPPSHVIFILATTEKHKILPTILSRCQIYDFERMTVPNTIAHLKMVAEKEGIQYEEQALAVSAEKADGGMRDALSIFDQAASFCQGNITYQKVIEDLNVLDSDNYFKLVDLALENKVSQMMLLLDNILGKGFDGGNMIQGLAQHVRNVMMAKDTQTLPLLETSEEQKAKYVEQAKKAPTPFLYKALQLMNNCDVQYRQSSNKRLLVELTLIQIGQITQPEDQDVPSAGRTPHRLKSLFQKIVAQLKPASQGAGAGQESGSKAPITGAQPVCSYCCAYINREKRLRGGCIRSIAEGKDHSQVAGSSKAERHRHELRQPGEDGAEQSAHLQSYRPAQGRNTGINRSCRQPRPAFHPGTGRRPVDQHVSENARHQGLHRTCQSHETDRTYHHRLSAYRGSHRQQAAARRRGQDQGKNPADLQNRPEQQPGNPRLPSGRNG